MKKLLLIICLLTACIVSGFSQNYVSGTVSLHGDNTASGTTTVAPGASLLFYHHSFYEQAGFINRGDSVAVSADTGTLVISGTAAQTVSGRFKLGGLRITNPAGGTIDNSEPVTMVTILDSVSFGDINNTSFSGGPGLLTLRSTALKTARVADLTHDEVNTGNRISGNVIAERYTQSRRAWRLLSPPTTADSVNDQTIKEAWQEGATAPRGQIVNPNPGYGTVITRPGNNPPLATGYDDGVAGSTIYSLGMYTKDGLYTHPLNTDLTHFSPHAAYLLFIRGDRSVPPETQSNSHHTPSAVTTLRSKGALHNGDVTDVITKDSGGFAGVANPYACTIDFSKVQLNGITNGFYVWDPTIGNLGAWVYIDGNDNYNATPQTPFGVGAYTNPATNVLIQSGQAFLLVATGSQGSVTFKESNKNITSRSDVFRMAPFPSVRISLYTKDSVPLFLDGTTAIFDGSFSKDALPDEDITKPTNKNENLSFYASSKHLMKEKWPVAAAHDTLPVRLWNTAVKKYRFVVEAANMQASPQAYLYDKYLQTSVPVTASLNYDFDVNKDAASKDDDRFAVVFGAGILPVTLTQIKAYLQNDGINVQWNVQNESGIAHYEIEKAGDGRTFSKIGTVAAQVGGISSFSYQFFDAQPYTGDNYYRVKSVESNGSFTYTSIVKVTVSGGIMTVTVYPNPVTDNVIRFLFKNAPASKYLVTLYGSDGKKVATKTIEHIGGTATYKLPAIGVAQGLYHATITGGVNNKEKRDVPVAIE